MTKAEEMVLKTVHDLGVAGDSDVQNYMGLSANKATRVLKSLERKGYLKIAAKRYLCGGDAYNGGIAQNTFIGNLWELTPKGRTAAKKIPDIDEPMCIPITNIQLGEMEERKEVLTDAAFLPDKETEETVHSLSGWAYKSNSQEQRATV